MIGTCPGSHHNINWIASGSYRDGDGESAGGNITIYFNGGAAVFGGGGYQNTGSSTGRRRIGKSIPVKGRSKRDGRMAQFNHQPRQIRTTRPGYNFADPR